MWILYAITASIFWGIDYALTGEVLKSIQFTTLLSIELFIGFLVMLGITVVSGAYRTDVPELLSSNRLSLFVVLIVIAFTIANTCIAASIGNQNATLAGFIEVSYPLFIIVFSWLFFKNTNITVGTAIGGACIIIGVAIILLLK